MPRPLDPVRVRFGRTQTFEVDPDWSYYGSLIFDPTSGHHVGWINARSQTGWQVFHTRATFLARFASAAKSMTSATPSLRRVNANPDSNQVLDGVATMPSTEDCRVLNSGQRGARMRVVNQSALTRRRGAQPTTRGAISDRAACT